MSDDREFTFLFTFDEAEYIIKKLGGCPYAEVHELIKKMKSQYEAQLNVAYEPTPMTEFESEEAAKVNSSESVDDECVPAAPPAPEP